MREALAAADHDFVLTESASKLKRIRDKILTSKRRALIRTARQGRRYLNIVATGFFIVAAIAILFNVLAWQRTRHPAPLFSGAAHSVPGKEPQSAELIVPPQRSQSSEKPAAQKPLAGKPLPDAAADGGRAYPPSAAGSSARDQISELLKGTPEREMPAPKAITPKTLKASPPSRSNPAKTKTGPATPSKSVMAAQRALVKLGFVLNPDGIAGKATRQAIESYERDHKLPVRGELTPALMRQLSAEIGTAEER